MNTTERGATHWAVWVLLFAVAMPVGAQVPNADPAAAHETQVKGYWVDPTTGLTWDAHDNGKDTSWGDAVKYCRNLRLAGYSDWRLPAMDELQSLVDLEAYSSKTAGSVAVFRRNTDLRVKGGLLLTGETQWSSSQVTDANGKPTGSAWHFDFADRSRWNHSASAKIHGHALCVRGSNATPPPPSSQETQERGYWVDSSTGLMWAAKDNGRDVIWSRAMKYCRNLQLAGYSDWRLSTIDELESLIHKEAYAAKTVGSVTSWRINMNLDVSGGLLLTGQTQWSSSTVPDDRGKPSGYAWYFDFVNVRRNKDDATFAGIFGHALCVRGASATPPPPSNGAQE